jgi:hypothetical protein
MIESIRPVNRNEYECRDRFAKDNYLFPLSIRIIKYCFDNVGDNSFKEIRKVSLWSTLTFQRRSLRRTRTPVLH